MSKSWKWFWRVAGLLVMAGLVAAGLGYREARSMGFLRAPVFETERPQLPQLAHPAVLVFSKTNGFIHKEAIPVAKQLLQQIAGEQGWSIFASDSGAVFNAGDLAQFDVVVWNNVTGDVLTSAQREAFQAWLQNGGGYVGLHASGDNSHQAWPWYLRNVIRAQFIGHPIHPQFQQAVVRIEQPADPIVAAPGTTWTRTDEWYSFAQSPRAPDLRVLATIDESSYEPGNFFGSPLAMGADHPVIWKHCVGRGRVFYSAMGHTAETYAEPAYREVLTRAIAWTGRMTAATATGPGTLACESP